MDAVNTNTRKTVEWEDTKAIWNNVGVTLIASPVLLCFRGYAIEKVWNWLAVPEFHVLPIGLLGGLIIGLLIMMFIVRDDDRGTSKHRKACNTIAMSFMSNGLILFYAWILTWFL